MRQRLRRPSLAIVLFLCVLVATQITSAANIAAVSAPVTDVFSPFIGVFILVGIIAGLKTVLEQWGFDKQRDKRRTYYRVTYLKSDDWKRKRAVVLKRDSYRCVHCGARATQVHHKRYARRNIGREPIEWLVSVCKPCHERQHK
jgi:hypothetical protein